MFDSSRGFRNNRDLGQVCSEPFQWQHSIEEKEVLLLVNRCFCRTGRYAAVNKKCLSRYILAGI